MAVVVVVEFFHLGCLGNVPPEGLSRFIFLGFGTLGFGMVLVSFQVTES